MSGLGGHRILDGTLPSGKLQEAAMVEVLDQVAFIFPLDITNVSVVSGASSFVITSTVGPSTDINNIGIVSLSNSFETTPEYANVELFTSGRNPITDNLNNILWGRVISVSGSAGSWTYTINIYKDTNRTIIGPTVGSLNTTSIDVVQLPYRKPLANLSQKDFKTDRVITSNINGDLAAVENRVTTLEGSGTPIDGEVPTGTIATGNYSFTLAHIPKTSSTKLIAYGLSLVQGVHYNISGSTLTYVAGFEPSAGEQHRVSYRY